MRGARYVHAASVPGSGPTAAQPQPENPVSGRCGWRARSISRSGSEGHFANRRSLTSTALAVHIGLRVPAENTPRTRTAGALCHDPAITCRKRQSGQIARANAPESARRATSAPHYIDIKTQTTALLPRIRCVHPHNGAFSFALYALFFFLP